MQGLIDVLVWAYLIWWLFVSPIACVVIGVSRGHGTLGFFCSFVPFGAGPWVASKYIPNDRRR